MVFGLRIVVASLLEEHGLWDVRASVVAAQGSQQLRLCSPGAQVQYLWCTGLAAPWHVGSSPTRIKPMSSALADGFVTTEPPGKSNTQNVKQLTT